MKDLYHFILHFRTKTDDPEKKKEAKKLPQKRMSLRILLSKLNGNSFKLSSKNGMPD